MNDFPCLTSPDKFSYSIVSFLPEDANLYLGKPRLKSFSKSVSTCYPAPRHGACPTRGQKEVSTQ